VVHLKPSASCGSTSCYKPPRERLSCNRKCTEWPGGKVQGCPTGEAKAEGAAVGAIGGRSGEGRRDCPGQDVWEENLKSRGGRGRDRDGNRHGHRHDALRQEGRGKNSAGVKLS